MENALDFLRNHVEVAFATSEGNLPHIRIFQIMKMEGTTLYFATNAKKSVWNELHKNPNIEIMASEGKVFVRCTGLADFEIDEATKQWIYEHNDVLSRLYNSYEDMSYFRMEIKQMDHYDLAPTPPYFKHYDLVNGTVGDGFIGTKYSK